MPIHLLARKMRSARYRLSMALAEWKEAGVASRKRRKFESWLADLRTHPPEVLVGSNFAEYGGVRTHIHAIAKHSSRRVELAPPDELLTVVSPHDFKTTFQDAFLDFIAPGLHVAHSHVFPWFIDWCSRHRGDGMLWVHTYHAPYFPEFERKGLLPWQAEINRALIDVARHADARISVSRWQQEWLRDNHGIDTIYLPNGVDVELCDAGDSARYTRLTGSAGFVLYVGRNDPVKNPADFVRLARMMTDHQFVMMGGGLSTDSLLADWEIELPGNLRVIGNASHADVQDAIAACGVLVVTSRREGLPTIVLEAMAHSKPVVAPNEPGSVEALGDAGCGFIYDPDDIGDLVEKTRAALSAPETGVHGRRRVLAEYDWRVVARQLDRIYDGVGDARPGTPSHSFSTDS